MPGRSCRGALWAFYGFEAWQTAGLNALNNRGLWPECLVHSMQFLLLVPLPAGLRVHLEGIVVWRGLWCLCLRGSECQNGGGGFGMPLLPWQATKEPSSTPPVVPGAAPALAKAGVGGYRFFRSCLLFFSYTVLECFGCLAFRFSTYGSGISLQFLLTVFGVFLYPFITSSVSSAFSDGRFFTLMTWQNSYASLRAFDSMMISYLFRVMHCRCHIVS